jgi:hypothetical protein
MSIRWVRNVIIEGEKSTLEIQLGSKKIGDKCYTRTNNNLEQWFENFSAQREDIIGQGIDLLRQELTDKKVTYPDGSEYDWK